jgi:hypothetical protein
MVGTIRLIALVDNAEVHLGPVQDIIPMPGEQICPVQVFVVFLDILQQEFKVVANQFSIHFSYSSDGLVESTSQADVFSHWASTGRERTLERSDARRVLLSLRYGAQAGKATPVFLGQRGRLTPRGFQILLLRYVKAANLKDVTPHSLRHSFCKNLVNAGVSLEKIAALAGHESLETTRRYCEPSLGELQQAVELVSEEE